MERFAQAMDEPLGCELAVAQLAALVLRDRADDRPGLGKYASLLRMGERRRSHDVEPRVDLRIRRVRVLPAGATGARGAKLDLGEWDHDRTGDADRCRFVGRCHRVLL